MPEERTGEHFVVGDVQGCSAELRDLLAAAGVDRARHRLAFVGDLINRGPDSLGVLRLARQWDARIVIGNHEEALLAGATGSTMARVRAQLGSELEEWLAWIRTWPVFQRIDDWILVHAGIAPGKRPEECSRAELTRIRAVDGKPWFDFWRGPETVIFGHWARLGKVDLPLVKGLDTGCVYGGALTGIYWPSGRWYSVAARKVYFDPIAHRANW
jgi:bis(5'-nucleosyl)-tetraphosphatase (symmetrical)